MIRAARLPPRAKCLVRRAVSSKEESAGLKWTRQERERDATKEGEGLEQDLLQVAPDREAGGSHLQATEEEERIVEWTRELREIRRMVELLQRRDRKLHVKADVAVRRLERLEKELPAGGRRARSQPTRLPRGQDQSCEARRRQVVRRREASAFATSRQARSSSSTPSLSEVPKSSRSALTSGCELCTTVLEPRGGGKVSSMQSLGLAA